MKPLTLSTTLLTELYFPTPSEIDCYWGLHQEMIMSRHQAIGDNSEAPKFARLLNRLEKIIVILRFSGD